MDIIQLIQSKLEKFGINLEEKLILVTLEEIDQAIKIYCNIDIIPNALLYVRANLVVDYIRYMEANKPNEAGNVGVASNNVGPLTSIKSGGISYTFANNTGNKGVLENAHIADIDDIINNYKAQLNRFRRITW